MSNLEIYNNIFVEVFGVDASVINDNFSKETIESWDSVHQLGIISLMEEKFDLLLDPEDIMGCTSYVAGKEILRRNGILL